MSHNNRVGDFDIFALLKLIKQGLTLDEIFRKLGKEGGLLGMSGVSHGYARCRKSRRRRETPGPSWRSTRLSNRSGTIIGEYLVALGGCDVLAFTGGIGENGIAIREAVCKNLQWAGIDSRPAEKPGARQGRKISTVESGVRNLDHPDQ